ncbi:MAG: hypothetical protein HC904_11265 [Blastochloris sp.]|nr:hypothetical protein [Blastochloris sp.]
MNLLQKIYTVLSVGVFVLAVHLVQNRETAMLSYSSVEIIAGLLCYGQIYLVYSDMKFRRFYNETTKLKWLCAMIVVPPLGYVYSLLVGFKKREF